MANETNPLSLSELLSRFVRHEASAQAAGETFHDLQGEIELHDAGAQPVVDVRKGWEEAQAALRVAGVPSGTKVAAFAEWPALLAAQESFLALPMAAGHTPQLVRNLQPLLLGALTLTNPGLLRPVPHASLRVWVENNASESPALRLLSAGLLRLARQFAEADQLLRTSPEAGWENAYRNERAGFLWAQGEFTAARDLWQQDTSGYLPSRFNRGMAALFLNDRDTARAELRGVLAELPEASAWHHLARPYLTLAEA